MPYTYREENSPIMDDGSYVPMSSGYFGALGFFGGGSTSNVIDLIDTTTTTGDAVDRGGLSIAREGLAGVSGPTYGFFGSSVVDYIDLSITTGNALNKGLLSQSRSYLAGVA